VERARIKGNPPLADKAHEADAARLARLVPAGSGDQVWAIGIRLSKAGGVPLMRYVAHRADALSLQNGTGVILPQIAVTWDKIGEWRADEIRAH
jgi:hypothetical protein